MKEGTVVPSTNFRIPDKSNRKIHEIQNSASNAPKFYLNLIHCPGKLTAYTNSLSNLSVQNKKSSFSLFYQFKVIFLSILGQKIGRKDYPDRPLPSSKPKKIKNGTI